jgi:hypothetical protein
MPAEQHLLSRQRDEEPSEGTGGGAPGAALDLVEEFRRQRGLDERFDRHVTEFFKQAIIGQYAQAFRAYLTGAGKSLQDVAELLQMHRATAARWGEEIPLEATFLYLAAAHLAVRDVGFPDGYEAVLGGMVKTLEHIRRRLGLPEPPCGPLDGVQLECLIFALGSEQWGETAWGEARTREELELLLERTAAAILAALLRDLPQTQVTDAAALRKLMGAWLIPWTLFDRLLPYEWHLL